MGTVAGRLTDKIRLARCDITKNPWAESQYQITVYVVSLRPVLDRGLLMEHCQ